ncbi:phosphodiesterase [Vibrio phage Va2]|nr:phosphodiesterase [Vibrio phage Va2]
MKMAIISDIHGNLQALDAVLDHASGQGVDEVVCLGDIVNYGADSEKCLDIVLSECGVVIEGNHENAVTTGNYEKFSSERGKKGAEETAFSLGAANYSAACRLPEKEVITAYKGEEEIKILLTHASVEDNWTDCLNDFMVDDNNLPDQRYSDYDYVLFGHTHIPTIQHKFFKVDNPEMRNKKKVTFINPGSVGQPRDHDPRASYCIICTETGKVEFIRVEYDIETAANAILSRTQFDEFYANRLYKGI